MYPNRIKRLTKATLAFFLLLIPILSWANPPLVDGTWLTQNLSKPNLLVLDLQPAPAYQQYHIPGAINSDYGRWRSTDKKGIPQMLPPVEELEKLIGGLGIDNDTHVVLVVTGRGAGELASATRVYWTLKVLGHDKVSILDGGLIAYAQDRNRPLEKGSNPPSPKQFKAQVRKEYLVDAEQIKQLAPSNVSLIDNRTAGEYVGLFHGDKERPGTIPGASNLPFSWLVINGRAQLHSVDNLRQIFRAQGVKSEGDQVYFCHTGHRASLAWFVAHEVLGNQKARLYDGSMAEWAVNPELPMDLRIQLK